MTTKLQYDDANNRRDAKRPVYSSAICAVWHGEPNSEEALLRGHAENLMRQTVPVAPIYVFDNASRPPANLAGQVICVREPLSIYQAWNVALSVVETPYVMNLNLDDRLAPNAVEQLEQALNNENGALAGGDWKICYSQEETDAVENCYPAEQLPVTATWPPLPGTVTRLGTDIRNATFGPATMWRMDLHIGAQLYPWRFSDGRLIRTIGDGVWWVLVSEHFKKKVVRLPLIIGHYYSHPKDQAEFRYSGKDEKQILSQVGVSAL